MLTAKSCLLKNAIFFIHYKVNKKIHMRHRVNLYDIFAAKYSDKFWVYNLGKVRFLLGHLMCLKDFRQLFLLFIRHFSPEIVSIQHLADVACTNHQFLIMAENFLSWEGSPPAFNMLDHVKRYVWNLFAYLHYHGVYLLRNTHFINFQFSFATVHIMGQYGHLLERYEENSHEVNDCVLTLMHHIAGDCNKHETLLQFPIIKKMAAIANYPSLSVVGSLCYVTT